jgi:hypothetical protein
METTRKLRAKPYTLSLFSKIYDNEQFPAVYDAWADLKPEDKERVLLRFTLTSTPPEWVASLKIQGKEIRYIKQHVAKRILNLLFGVANWHIEIVEMTNIAEDDGYSAAGWGYLVVKWFDGSERKIATAGGGRVWKKNVVTSKGDDLKMVISDMTKKALANLGFFADIYGTVEAVEDVKGRDETEVKRPQYNYHSVKKAVDNLIDDYMDGGVITEERLMAAENICKSGGFNDLLLKINDIKNGRQVAKS